MSRRTLNILGILILMVISAGIGVLGYITIVGGSGEASATISAPTLSVPTPNGAETQVAVLSTQVSQLTAANAALVAAAGSAQGISNPEATAEATIESTTEATTEATVESTAEATTEAASQAAASSGTLFRIVPDQSEVRFILTEDLLGKPNTVTGLTNQVAGDIFVDLQTPANSQVGQININVRTLTTDSELRNNAIRSRILQSTNPDYEFSTFTPTAITGLPDTIEVGQQITFKITGDLKVRDIVQSVTFDVTATLTTADQLQGTASAQITRDQYNLTIPNAPGVANVSNDMRLEIDFVATKVTQ